MNPGRLFREYRPEVILVLLLLGSFFSLILGTESSFIHRGLSRAVSITSYPLLKVQYLSSQTAQHAYNFVANYNTVFKENESLTQEVATLRSRTARIHSLEEENKRIRTMLNFTRKEPQMDLLPVSILESYKGLLRIDGGAQRGIRVSMGAITPDGVVGVVTDVADFTATVATIHHMDCRVGVMVLRNRLRAYDGIIHASGSDFNQLCAMEYIDMKEEVRVGDWVVTSPESQFPSGLPLGRIRAVRSGSGLWKSAEIEPAVDPYRLDEIFIIMHATEDVEYITDLPNPLDPQEAEEVSFDASEMPDTRSLQERFAP
jgi:rod shape-determining protein MreC